MPRRRLLAFSRARGHRPLAPRSAYRPTVEALEDRWLPSVDVLTAHNDNARDGLNNQETALTPSDVNSSQFGKLFSVSVDGQVYAQPLYVAGLTLPNQGTHNVVFVATEHDSVYAFDADTGTLLWHDSFINPSAGVTTVSSSDVNCDQITPEIGVTATPVIDLNSGTMYVESETKVVSGGTTTFVQALHALDVGTGAEKLGGPVTIQASVSGTGDGGSTVSLIPKDYKARAGLLLNNGVVYVSFASNCDITPAHGWMVGYNASTLKQVAVLCTSPDSQLNTIWMSNGGPAADSSHNVYAVTGNGPISSSSNGFNPSQGDYAETVLKLSTASGLSVADYFTPYNWQTLDANDEDFGSGGVVLFDQPGATDPNLLVTAGKQGTIYLINRNNLGQFHSGGDSVVQELPGAIGGSYGSPAYFNNTVYYGGVNDTLKAFSLSNGLLGTSPSSHSSNSFAYPGTTPSVSANGTSNGIVWAIGNGGSHGTLYAYNAANLADELYNSDQAGTRDQLGAAVKFTTPTIADGKVFVGTSNQLTVFGELSDHGTNWSPLNGPSPASSPVVANQADGVQEVAAIGPNGGLWVRFQDAKGNATGWSSVGGNCVSLAATANGAGYVDVFASFTNGTVWEFAHTASGFSWVNLGGSATGPIAAATESGGAEQVCSVGSDGGLWLRWVDSAGNKTGWADVGGSVKSVAASRNGAGLVDAFAVFSDGTLHEFAHHSAGSFSWVSLGGSLAGPIAVGLESGGVEQIAAVGSDGGLWLRWVDSVGGMTGWADVNGGPIKSVAVTTNSAGLVDTFVALSNGTVAEFAHPSASTFSWVNGLGTAFTALAAGTDSTGREDLFAIATDGSLWERLQTSPGNW